MAAADTTPELEPDLDRTQPQLGGTLPQRGLPRGIPFGPPLIPGEAGSLGPYRVVRQLGRGGMGAVFLGVDTRLDRKVALKVVLPEYAVDPESRERFLREARAAAQVTHDNVVTVYEADERDGVPYIAMQFLDGLPLDEFLKKKGAPTLPQIVRVGREAAAGLGAAHKLGLVHRDVKPGNLWLEAPNGRVKVLDFGLAKPVHADHHLTASGLVVGTPSYMAPEQARGKPTDARADLFALGVVLYRLCTGRLPFDGPTTMAVLMALGTDDPVPVRDLNPTIPEGLAALVHQLLEKDPDARPQSADEVVRRLRAGGGPHGASQVVVTPAPRVVYVPLAVTAPDRPNPFADLDATQSHTAAPGPGSTPGPGGAPEAPAQARGRRWPLAAAVGAAALLAALVGAAALKARGKGGAEPRADHPPPAPAPQKERNGKAAPAKPPADPDRAAALWVLSHNLSVNVSTDPRSITSPAELPRERFALTWVNLANKPVTDTDLAHFKDCKGLRSVTLHATKATDAGIAHFKGCKDLESFNFSHTGGGDAALAHLKESRGLKDLWAQDTGVTDAGLLAAKEFKALQLLYLSGTKVTDAGLAHLRELPELKTLALDMTAVSDAGLQHLHELTGLTALSVRQTRVTARGVGAFRAAVPECRVDWDGGTLEPLAPDRAAAEMVLALGGTVTVGGSPREVRSADELPKGAVALTGVQLVVSKVTDDQLARFRGCKQLMRLNLQGTVVTAAGVAHLKECPELRELHLCRTGVTDDALAHLKGCPNLTLLCLSGAPITDAGLAHLKGCGKLQMLALGGTLVTDAGLPQLYDLKTLGQLSLRGTRTSEKGLAALRAALPECRLDWLPGEGPK